jgi:hypothetical protein
LQTFDFHCPISVTMTFFDLQSRAVASMTEDDPGVESEKVSDNILG